MSFVCAVQALVGCAGDAQPTPSTSMTWQLQSSGTSQPLYDVACLSEVRCMAVGGAGTILATDDGGETWHAQANPAAGSSAPLYRIACVAPESCYVIARPDTIFVTHNGGAAWTSHRGATGLPAESLTDGACLRGYTPIAGRPELCRLGLLDIACSSATDCQAVATSSAAYGTALPGTGMTPASSVWSTQDGGSSWTDETVPAGVSCDADCD
ncbi:MAG TPA: YCF48-related protein [Candidatus Dormibacteraeota bacterium]